MGSVAELLFRTLRLEQRIALMYRSDPTLWNEPVVLRLPPRASSKVIVTLTPDWEMLEEDIGARDILEIKRVHGRRVLGKRNENVTF